MHDGLANDAGLLVIDNVMSAVDTRIAGEARRMTPGTSVELDAA